MNERPDLRERIASGLSISGPLDRGLLAEPGLAGSTAAALIGAVEKPLHKIVIAAACTDWTERTQLYQILLRRSWDLWRQQERSGNFTIELNQRVARLVLDDWLLPVESRAARSDASRTTALGIDHRRWKGQIEDHYYAVIGWLDGVTVQAMRAAARGL